MTKIAIRRGSEGPRHDPYGYVELTVERFGHTFEIHTGLACWVRVDGKEIDLHEDALAPEFERLTGFHPGEWHR